MLYTVCTKKVCDLIVENQPKCTSAEIKVTPPMHDHTSILLLSLLLDLLKAMVPKCHFVALVSVWFGNSCLV